MPTKFTIWGTKVEFRERDGKEHSKVFRGEDHAIKAAQFVVANKKEWDYHNIMTLKPS